MVLILAGSPDIALGFFVSIITQQYGFHAKKEVEAFLVVSTTKKRKWHFSGKLIKKSEVSYTSGNKRKITESILVLFI